jgi:hypothetical protein
MEKPAKKHAAKHAAKHAKKHAGPGEEKDHREKDLARAYFHFQRSAGMMAALTPASNDFIRPFFEQGAELYRNAHASKNGKAAGLARISAELLRAVEHFAAAAICSEQKKPKPQLPAPKIDFSKERKHIADRVAGRARGKSSLASEKWTEKLAAAAQAFLQRSEEAEQDEQPHLAHEFLKASDALSKASEE